MTLAGTNGRERFFLDDADAPCRDVEPARLYRGRLATILQNARDATAEDWARLS